MTFTQHFVEVAHIVEHASAEDLMLMYSLPAFPSGDVAAFLSGVARSNHLVKKVIWSYLLFLPVLSWLIRCFDVRQFIQRGEPDLVGASKIVLQDWNTGKFARYTCPPNDGCKNLTLITEVDGRILNRFKTRKELRKNGGLVRLRVSEDERRVVQMENPWEDEKESNDQGDIEANQVDEEGEGDGSGSDEDEHGNSDEQEERLEKDLIPHNKKRKRTVSFGFSHSAKKTAFTIQEGQKRNETFSATVKKRLDDENTIPILKKRAAIKQKSLEVNPTKSAKKAPVKVANVSSSHKNKKTDNSDPSAYDFSKFF